MTVPMFELQNDVAITNTPKRVQLAVRLLIDAHDASAEVSADWKMPVPSYERISVLDNRVTSVTWDETETAREETSVLWCLRAQEEKPSFMRAVVRKKFLRRNLCPTEAQAAKIC